MKNAKKSYWLYSYNIGTHKVNIVYGGSICVIGSIHYTFYCFTTQ